MATMLPDDTIKVCMMADCSTKFSLINRKVGKEKEKGREGGKERLIFSFFFSSSFLFFSFLCQHHCRSCGNVFCSKVL